MKIALLDLSSKGRISLGDLERIAHAIEVQLFEHYAPFWEERGIPVRVIRNKSELLSGESLIALFDDADQAGVLGWHSVSPSGLAYGRVFVEPIFDSGGTILESANSVSVTISHEALEMASDPYINAWHEADGGVLHAREACDAVEADAYDCEGVMVSNFVGPRFFRKGDGPYDWMRLVKKPFETRPGGYQIVRIPTKAEAELIYGEAYPEWKLAGKKHPAARSAKRKGHSTLASSSI
jgi:hypothetical protein